MGRAITLREATQAATLNSAVGEAPAGSGDGDDTISLIRHCLSTPGEDSHFVPN